MMKEERNMMAMMMSCVKNVIQKFIVIIIVHIVVIRKQIVMKEIVCDMEDVKDVLKQILTSAGVYLAKLKNRMLGFLRHQITIWIIMKEKQNIMIIVTSYVKNVVKKLISIIPVEIVIVIERKLIVMKE